MEDPVLLRSCTPLDFESLANATADITRYLPAASYLISRSDRNGRAHHAGCPCPAAIAKFFGLSSGKKHSEPDCNRGFVLFLAVISNVLILRIGGWHLADQSKYFDIVA